MKNQLWRLLWGASVVLALSACGVGNTSQVVSVGGTLQTRVSASPSGGKEAFVLPTTHNDNKVIFDVNTTSKDAIAEAKHELISEQIAKNTHAQSLTYTSMGCDGR
jgi:hypothetical protein